MAIIIAGAYPDDINRENPHTGLLVLVEEGTEHASDQAQYDADIIGNITRKIAQSINNAKLGA